MVDAMGNESVLYGFTGGADGANPEGGVIRDSAGNLYGTTFHGGLAETKPRIYGSNEPVCAGAHDRRWNPACKSGSGAQ